MRPADNIKRLVKKLNDSTSSEMDERVLTDVLKALTETEKLSAPTRPKLRRILMKSSITKLAAAAVIVIAVLIGINQLGGKATGVVWGEVVRNIEASPGFVFRMKQIHKDKEKGMKEYHMKVYGSAEYGVRMDGYLDPQASVQTYASRKQEALISIMHASKTYSRQPLTGDQLVELEVLDPKKSFRELLSIGHRKLGRKIIEGVEAEGVEITNPEGARISSERLIEIDSHVSRLWVSVETELPVYFESKTICNNGALELHTIQDEFQWNVELDESEFVPNIPEHYTQTGKPDAQEGEGAKLKKWRFEGKDPQRGYLLVSEDGQFSTNVPESWADSPEHAVRIQEELDLLKQQDRRALVEVFEIEANGQLDYRILKYEYTLSDGQTIKSPDFKPDDPGQWTVTGERQKELRQLREEGKGQELTSEERQVHGRIFTFKKHRYVLSDGTEIIRSVGRLKDD
jgi:hypothetical protein